MLGFSLPSAGTVQGPTLGLVLRCRTSSSCLRKPSSCDRPILRREGGRGRRGHGDTMGRGEGPRPRLLTTGDCGCAGRGLPGPCGRGLAWGPGPCPEPQPSRTLWSTPLHPRCKGSRGSSGGSRTAPARRLCQDWMAHVTALICPSGECQGTCHQLGLGTPGAGGDTAGCVRGCEAWSPLLLGHCTPAVAMTKPLCSATPSCCNVPAFEPPCPHSRELTSLPP